METEEQNQVGVALGRCPRCGQERPADLVGPPVQSAEAGRNGGGAEYSLLRCHTCGTPYLQRGSAVILD